MTNKQPLPDWLKAVTLTYQNSDQVTAGLVELPITYSGPPIPIAWPYTSIDQNQIQTQTQALASAEPMATQVVHFYDGGGPFTVIGGTIITDINLMPKPTGNPNPNPNPVDSNQNHPSSIITDTRIPTNSQSIYSVFISTITITAPSPSTSNTTNPLLPSNNNPSQSNPATALVAGFIILLILLVFIVLALLVYLLRRQGRRRRQHDHHSPHHSIEPVQYEFNSALLPQHHHGSQSAHPPLDHVPPQFAWSDPGLEEPKPEEEEENLHEKQTAQPTQQQLLKGSESHERKLTAWKRFQVALRHEFNAVLKSISIDSNERQHPSRGPITDPAPARYLNPYHDPSISTTTFTRVKNWWDSVLTPSSSMMSAPHTFKTLSGSDTSNDEIDVPDQDLHPRIQTTTEAPFIFNKSSTLSPSIESPIQLPESYQNTPKKALPMLDLSALKVIKKSKLSIKNTRSKQSSKPKSIGSRTSSHPKPDLDHPPLLARVGHGASEDEADDGHSITGGSDSPLEHFHPYGLPHHSPSATKRSNETSTSGTPNARIDSYVKRIRAKKNSPRLSPPHFPLSTPLQTGSSPRSMSYQSGLTPTNSSPGKILVLKKQKRSSGASDRLRFPLPPVVNKEEKFVEVLPAGIESGSSASRTTEDEEILFVGRRRSSISHLGGVSELGVVEPGGPRQFTQDGSYVSEDLFYVRPRLATFRDGRWITDTPSDEGKRTRQSIGQLGGSGVDLDIMATPKGSNNHKETMRSTKEFPSFNENRRTVNRCVSSNWVDGGIDGIKSFFRSSGHRTVSLPIDRPTTEDFGRSFVGNDPNEIKVLNRKLSPLDQLKKSTRKASQTFKDHEHRTSRSTSTDSDDRSVYDDDENSFDDDESSRLLSRQSRYSRATLGQRLVIGEDILSLKGSLQKGSLQRNQNERNLNERFKDLEEMPRRNENENENEEDSGKEEEIVMAKGKDKVMEVEPGEGNEGESDLSSNSLYATPLCRSQKKSSG